jgi:hypothetical protein
LKVSVAEILAFYKIGVFKSVVIWKASSKKTDTACLALVRNIAATNFLAVSASPKNILVLPMKTGKNAPNADGDFYNSANFNWYDGQLNFDNRNVDNANVNYGSASGFLPLCLLLQRPSAWRGGFLFKAF